MKFYRIYTENKNRKGVEEIVASCCDGFTISEARGYWKGSKENALVIEILTEYPHLLRDICVGIKNLNQQEAVLYTEQEVKANFI